MQMAPSSVVMDRTATLGVVARMVSVGVGAGVILAVAAALTLVPGDPADAVGWLSLAAMTGLWAGAVTGLANAFVAVAALRRRPGTAAARVAVVPLPVAAAVAAAMLSTSGALLPTAVAGLGAVVIAIVAAPWCLAPARSSSRSGSERSLSQA